MRILMTSHGYPPTLSGVTRVVQKLARALVRKSHAVTVVMSSSDGEPRQVRDAGVDLVRVRSVSNPFWGEGPIPWISQKDLEELAARFQPDALHAHDPAVLGVQLQRLEQGSGTPAVATCYYVPRFAARYVSWDETPVNVVESIVWAYSIWLFNQFDRVVFATEAHRQRFVRQGLEAATTLISNGVDLTRYRPGMLGMEEVEARTALPAQPRILFVSRLARDKEIDVLIRAMGQGPATEGVHLLLVGRGDDRPRLEALRQELGLEGHARFLGFVPEEDLPALYQAADLFAIASKCEVQSLPSLQAAATGLPVVAADAVALPELVEHGINGYLVPPDDPQAMAAAILRIVRHPDRAARMGQASLDIVQPHTESATFDAYENLYRRVLAAA
jgi:1,2-diacylglycerol 3-alpha-glucosyltransferase